MKVVGIHRVDPPLSTPIQARYCSSFLCRLRGLTFRKELDLEEGLLLVGPRENRLDAAIHMIGVRMDLAVFWLDSGKKIVDRQLARKWHPLYIPDQPAKYVLELSAGRYEELNIGEVLEFEEVSID